MARIQVRRDTAAAWTAANPTLTAGEIGFETDTGKVKVGDGTAVWTALAYLAGEAAVTVKNSIEEDAGDLQLVGDAASPGNSRYYGTDGTGVKGFFELPAGSGSASFTGLNDTPADYTAAAEKAVAVNAGGTGLEFVDFPAGAGGGGGVAPSRYYMGMPGIALTNSLIASDYLTGRRWLEARRVESAISVTAVGVTVTTEGTTGQSVRLGIYKATSINLDTVEDATLVVDAGTILVDTQGVKRITLGTPVTLEPGHYFAALVTDSSALRTQSAGDATLWGLRGIGTGYSRYVISTATDVDVSTAFPATFGAAGAPTQAASPSVNTIWWEWTAP